MNNKIIYLENCKPSLKEYGEIKNVKETIEKWWPKVKEALDEVIIIENFEKWEKESIEILNKALEGKEWTEQKRTQYIEISNQIKKNKDLVLQIPLLIAHTIAISNTQTITIPYKNYKYLLKNMILEQIPKEHIKPIIQIAQEQEIKTMIENFKLEDDIDLIYAFLMFYYEKNLKYNNNDIQKTINQTKFDLKNEIKLYSQGIQEPEKILQDDIYYFGKPILTIPLIYSTIKKDLIIIQNMYQNDTENYKKWQQYNADEIIAIKQLSEKEQLLYLNVISHYNRRGKNDDIEEDILRVEHILYISKLFTKQDILIKRIQEIFPQELFAQQLINQVNKRLKENQNTKNERRK